MSDRPSPFQFTSVHAYLDAWKRWRAGARREPHSFEGIARAWSFRCTDQKPVSKAYVRDVFRGRATVPLARMEALIELLELDDAEAEGFAAMTVLARRQPDVDRLDGDPRAQRFAQEVVQSIRMQLSRARWARNAGTAETAYVAHRWAPTLREMLLLPDARPTPQWIHARSSGLIGLDEAAEGLDVLESLGVVDRTRSPPIDAAALRGLHVGIVDPTDADAARRTHAIRAYHLSMIGVAERVADRDPERAHLHHVELWLTDAEYAAVRDRVDQLALDFVSRFGSASDEPPDRVAHLGIQLVPADP